MGCPLSFTADGHSRNLNAALRGLCQPRDLVAQHMLWRAAKKEAKQTGTHRFVPLSIEHHVAQSNDVARTVRDSVPGSCLSGYAHYLGVARIHSRQGEYFNLGSGGACWYNL